jgi:hypothetical protein
VDLLLGCLGGGQNERVPCEMGNLPAGSGIAANGAGA